MITYHFEQPVRKLWKSRGFGCWGLQRIRVFYPISAAGSAV